MPSRVEGAGVIMPPPPCCAPQTTVCFTALASKGATQLELELDVAFLIIFSLTSSRSAVFVSFALFKNLCADVPSVFHGSMSD